MKYESKHFKERPTPVDWQCFVEGELRYVHKLCPQLRSILDTELNAGNQIWEASGGWPERDSIFIALTEPFTKKHAVSRGVTFENTNDPHYWKSAYISEEPKHILACQFE